MQDFVSITGMILKTVPISDYDRRIVILTKERGKIAAFVKGARRQNSRFMAATDVFCFGEFKLYPGKNSYNLMDMNIQNYFEELRMDFEGAYYGMYFLEIADYYTRENNDEKEMLKLVYQSMRALLLPSIPNRLVRYIYEMKAVMVNGEFPGASAFMELSEAAAYTVGFIEAASVERLYTFSVSEEILAELSAFTTVMRKHCLDRKFKSLEILETLVENP